MIMPFYFIGPYIRQKKYTYLTPLNFNLRGIQLESKKKTKKKNKKKKKLKFYCVWTNIILGNGVAISVQFATFHE